jgi:putative membrane protein
MSLITGIVARRVQFSHIRIAAFLRSRGMKTRSFAVALGIALAFSPAYAADKEKSDKASATDTAFIMKAADGGMTEVELGKVAEKNGQRDDVKSFGGHMIKDHGKAGENLKGVASKMNVTVPDKVSPKHQAMIDKMSKLSGSGFDAAYIKAMVEDHEEDVAEFEKARGQVSNEDLKKFIDETLPVIKEHLEMVKKMQATK